MATTTYYRIQIITITSLPYSSLATLTFKSLRIFIHEKCRAHYKALLCHLDVLTKLAVEQRMCHPYIKNSHQLMVADICFPDNDSTPAVVSVCLYRLIHGKTLPEPLSVQSDMDVSLEVDNRLLRYHSMLEGILLSECMWLGQRSFDNKLISLFNQFNNPELRPKLMWLCWYDLILGFPLDDWVNTLKVKTEEQLVEWIIGRQMENWGLTRIMDDYVLFG